MIDRDKQCGACQNLDAYWQERARQDPSLRERLLQLQKQKDGDLTGFARDGQPEAECPEECEDEPKDPAA